MREEKRLTVIILGFVALAIASSPAAAREMDEPVMLTPAEIAWTPGPASMPPGSEVAIMEGDPKQEGLVTMRLSLPPNYQLPPHTQSNVERVTVISGTLYFGHGEQMEPAKAKELPAGSFFLFPPDTPMFGFTREQGTVIQLNVEAPWDVFYLNPEDDPRN
jgi:quercetin dioxygenase-like cupin family protein